MSRTSTRWRMMPRWSGVVSRSRRRRFSASRYPSAPLSVPSSPSSTASHERLTFSHSACPSRAFFRLRAARRECRAPPPEGPEAPSPKSSLLCRRPRVTWWSAKSSEDASLMKSSSESAILRTQPRQAGLVGSGQAIAEARRAQQRTSYANLETSLCVDGECWLVEHRRI